MKGYRMDTFRIIPVYLVMIAASFAWRAGGFEIITPTSLREAMPRKPGIPVTSYLRPYDPDRFTPASLPDFTDTGAAIRAVVAVPRAARDTLSWAASALASTDGDAAAFTARTAALPGASSSVVPGSVAFDAAAEEAVRSLVTCDVAVDTGDDSARGAVLFFVGDGLGGGVNTSCTVRERETIARDLGAVAMVIVDVRDRTLPTKASSTSSGEDGIGVMPVWGIGRAAGMAIVERILAREDGDGDADDDVTVKMYQLPPTNDALNNLRRLYGASRGQSWTYPSPLVAGLVDPLMDARTAVALVAAGNHVLFCVMTVLTACTSDGEISGLHLSGYVIGARLPEDIGLFPHLEFLRASLSEIEAPLPRAIGTLSSLREIEIVDNPQLAGSPLPDLSGLSRLWLLRISGAMLEGSIPSFAAMVQIREVDLADNRIVGGLPPLGTWSEHLSRLSVRENALTGTLDALGDFAAARALTALDVSSNPLEGQIPRALSAVTTLVSLRASDTNITGALPDDLGALTRLVELVASHTRIDALPSAAALEGMGSLATLALRGCALHGPLPARLPPAIRRLDLRDNAFTQLPESGAWHALGQLTDILLSNNRIHENITRLEKAFPSSSDLSPVGVSVIDLSDNLLGSNSTYPNVNLDLSNYSRLRELRLAGNNLRGQLVITSHTDDTPEAAVLDVSRNPGIGGGIQSNLGSFSFDVVNVTGTSMVHNIYADGIVASPSGHSGPGGEAVGGEALSLDDLTELALAAVSRTSDGAFEIADYLYSIDGNVHSPTAPPELRTDIAPVDNSANATNATLEVVSIDTTSVNTTNVTLAVGDGGGGGSGGGGAGGATGRGLSMLLLLTGRGNVQPSLQKERFAALVASSGRHRIEALQVGTTTSDNDTALANTTTTVDDGGDDDGDSNNNTTTTAVSTNDADARSIARMRAFLGEALPASIATDHSVRTFHEELNMWCPALRGADTASTLVLVADPEVHGFAHCVCRSGYTRVAGNRCHPCPDMVSCPGMEEQMDMIVEPGFFPTPTLDEPLAVVACPASVLSETACNPDAQGTFACAQGYEGRLCSECSDGFFRRNGLCFKCSESGIAFTAVAFSFVIAIFASFFMRLLHLRVAAVRRPDALGVPREEAQGLAQAKEADLEAGAAAAAAGALYSAPEKIAPSPPADTPTSVSARSRHLPPWFIAMGDMRAMTLLSIALFYAQTLSLSMDGFDLPKTLGIVKEVYDTTNVSITSLGAGCVVGRMSFRASHLLAWTSPIAVLAAMWFIAALVTVVPTMRRRAAQVFTIAATMGLVLLSIIFFPMSKGSLSKLRSVSDPVTRVAYFAEAPSIEFDAIPFVEKIVPVVLYPVSGFLLIVAIGFVVYRRRRGATAASPAAAPYPEFAAWFFVGFKDRFWFAPIALFSRRLVVAAIIALVPEQNAIRYATVAVIIIISAAGTLFFEPYRLHSANILEASSLVAAAVIFVCSFIAANDTFTDTGALIVFIFAVHIAAFTLFVTATCAVMVRVLKQNSTNSRSYKVERFVAQKT